MGAPKAAELSTLDLGDARVTYLPDGLHTAPSSWLFPQLPADARLAADEDTDQAGAIVMSVGGILIESETGTVLVDLGNGPRPRPPQGEGAHDRQNLGGELLNSLASIGKHPSQIDDIIITHLHLDHTGWAVDPDQPEQTPFVNATFHMSPAEWQYWTQPHNLSRGTGPSPDQVAVIRPRLRFCVEGTVQGAVSALATPGHTPGHLAVSVTGTRGRVIVLGDAMHCRFELRATTGRYYFDLDHTQAARSRQRLLSELTTPDTWYAGGHFATTVFGRLGERGDFHDGPF